MTLAPARDASLHPSQFFAAGLTLGVLVGFVLGSLLALWLGDETLEALRYLVDRVMGRRQRINFELLLQ